MSDQPTDDGRDWQRDQDVAENAGDQTGEEIEDYRADLILSEQLDNDLQQLEQTA